MDALRDSDQNKSEEYITDNKETERQEENLTNLVNNNSSGINYLAHSVIHLKQLKDILHFIYNWGGTSSSYIFVLQYLLSAARKVKNVDNPCEENIATNEEITNSNKKHAYEEVQTTSRFFTISQCHSQSVNVTSYRLIKDCLV